MSAILKTTVVNGTPLDYAPADLKRNRVTTISLTGSGTASVWVTHLDNDPVKVIDAEAVPMAPYSIFGVGYSNIQIVNETGTLAASISSVWY